MKYHLSMLVAETGQGDVLILVIQRARLGVSTESLTAIVLASQQSLANILSIGEMKRRHCPRCLSLWMTERWGSIATSK